VDTSTSRRIFRDLREDFERMQLLFKGFGADNRVATAAWRELLKPREGLIRFSDERVALADSPEELLDQLYGRYVERNFVTKEYREQILERNVAQILRSVHLSERFARAAVGNDEYHVNFPFVEFREAIAVKAIKPLSLNQDDSAKIIEHGGQWAARVRNLSRRKLLPEHVLFAFDGDDSEETLKGQARRDVLSDLRDLGAEVASVRDAQRVADFARDHSR